MKYLLILMIILISGCDNGSEVFMFNSAYKYECINIVDVKSKDIFMGDFILCTREKYNKRIK